MKRFARFMAALLIAALCLSAAALADGQVTTTGSVNQRSGAGLGYQSLRVIPEGVTLNYDSTSWDSRGVLWYHVTYNGHGGWVSSRYAREGGGSGGQLKTTATVNLRSGAGVEYSVLSTVAKGASVTWDKKADDSKGVTWYHVSYNGWTGWICGKYTSKGGGSGSGSSSSSSSSSSGSGKVTTTGSLNLRSGAGLGYQSLKTVPKGVTLSWDKSSKDSRGVTWYHVTYKGTSGWVSSKYTKKASSSASSSGSAASGQKPAGVGTQVIGDTGKSNVHTGPGLAYDTLGVLHKGEAATYLNQTSVDDRGVVWFKITWEGREAWVSSRYTTLW